jgi:hypothetical protein
MGCKTHNYSICASCVKTQIAKKLSPDLNCELCGYSFDESEMLAKCQDCDKLVYCWECTLLQLAGTPALPHSSTLHGRIVQNSLEDDEARARHWQR